MSVRLPRSRATHHAGSVASRKEECDAEKI
jgi:hypothetical protein